MINRAISLIAVCSALLMPSLAKAQTACQTIDEITHTVALVRTAQAASTVRGQTDAARQIESILSRISVPALLSSDVREDLPQDSRAIVTYVSSLREAVEASKDGHAEFAQQVLTDAISPSMAGGIRALTSYWNCNPNDAGQALGENAFQAESEGASGTNEQAPSSGKRVQSVGDGSNLRDRSTERQSGDGSYLTQDVVVEGNILSFLLMLGLLALVGLFVFLYRRRKSFSTREARRVLNRPISVRFGNAESQLLLVDISMNGAKLQHPGGLDGERRIDLNLNGFWHAAQIKWSNPLFAGIMFKTPLDEDTLQAVVK